MCKLNINDIFLLNAVIMYTSNVDLHTEIYFIGGCLIQPTFRTSYRLFQLLHIGAAESEIRNLWINLNLRGGCFIKSSVAVVSTNSMSSLWVNNFSVSKMKYETRLTLRGQ